jgi:hypothetical protein
MGLPRSNFYDAPTVRLDEVDIVARMQSICDEFETYGYRRINAELRHHGIIAPRCRTASTRPGSRSSMKALRRSRSASIRKSRCTGNSSTKPASQKSSS